MTHPIDAVELAFDPASLTALQVVLGLVMFGVALDLSIDDFRRLAARPIAPAVGLVAQLLLLPALTWALSRALPIPPSMRLGLLMVAACPGGNVSNFITHVGGGRTETSVGMTAISTVLATVTTPLLLATWGGMSPDTAALLTEVSLDPWDMLRSVATLLLVPIAVGLGVAHRLPALAARLRGPFQILSLAFFGVFLVVAFRANLDHFLAHIGTVFLPVAALNALALGTGYGLAALVGLDVADRRAVAVEVGIQNSGLGLVLVFAFFDGLGGMAVVCAWWGLWHLIAGFGLAAWWRRHPVAAPD